MFDCIVIFLATNVIIFLLVINFHFMAFISELSEDWPQPSFILLDHFLLLVRSVYSRTFDHSIVMIPNVRNPQNDASSNSYHVFSFLFPRSYIHIGSRNVYVFIWLSVSNSKYGTDVLHKNIE